jgi:hypothetical protein
MQIVTKLLDHLNIGEATPAPTAGVLAKELKDKSKKFKSFAETPFQTGEVVIYETAEDIIDC